LNFQVKKLKFFALSVIILIYTLLSLGAEEKFSPQKIACLSPSGAEILCALDSFDKIKARTDYCDYPEELKTLPSVGGFDGKTLSIETILAYSPDFVYGSQGMHDFLKKPLEKLGIKVFLSNAANGISQTKQEILYIANLLEKQAEGKKIIEHIEQQINSVPKSAPTKTIYYEVWNEPFITAGKSSFINELLEAAGYKNVFDSIKESYPFNKRKLSYGKRRIDYRKPAANNNFARCKRHKTARYKNAPWLEQNTGCKEQRDFYYRCRFNFKARP